MAQELSLVRIDLKSVLSTGRNFVRKTQKRPDKNLHGRQNLLPIFFADLSKSAEKWPTFSEVYSSHQSLDYFQK
jgi:hypothetical protein